MIRVIHLPGPAGEHPANLWGGYTLPPEPPELPGENTPPLRHLCGAGGAPKPDRPRYRRCDCGQWYHYAGTLWRPVGHPPRRWLREHGIDPGEYWTAGDDPGPRMFEDFAVRRPTLLMLLRWLFRDRD